MINAKQCAAKYPGDQSSLKWQVQYMIMWDVPDDINNAIPALPNKIYCNKDMVAPLEKAFRNLIAAGKASELKTWDGCFNIRKVRGASSPSMHSWGVAIDVNAAWNGLNKIPQLSKAFVKSFKDAGFDWGGDWQRLDGMHFQLSTLGS